MRRAFLALLLSAAPAFADGPAYWPQWRGPTGQGYATDDRVPLEWSATKNLAWKTKLPGGGHSTPVVWGDRLFLTCASADGRERFVVCVRTTNGEILWSRSAAPGEPSDKTHSTSSFAAPSCAVDGERVYAFFGTPGLFCYDFEGKPLWHRRFGVFTSETGWGVGASPVLFEDLVILNCDNDGPAHLPKGSKEQAAPAALVALVKTSGKPVWVTPRDQGRGFSTPVLISSPSGRTDLVLNGPRGVWAYDPKTGSERWHRDRHPDEDNNKFGEPMPLSANGILYAAAGREGGYLQAIRQDDGELVWEVPRKGIRDVGSGVLVGDVLIFGDGRGALLSAHDIKTGKQLYSERSKGAATGKGTKGFYSSPLLLNGKVLCLRQDGVTFVLEPGRSLKVVRENVLSDGTDFSASPAVADGRLFLRSQTHLYCVGAK